MSPLRRMILTADKQALRIHDGGHADYSEVTCCDQRLREEKAKLRRRLRRFCMPRGIFGDLRVWRRERRLVRKLHLRFEVPYAVF